MLLNMETTLMIIFVQNQGLISFMPQINDHECYVNFFMTGMAYAH